MALDLVPQVFIYLSLDSQISGLFILDDPVLGVLDTGPGVLAGDLAVDVTDESQIITVNRGRTDELSEFPAGTCTVTWPNDLRQLDPLYALSAYFGEEFVAKRLQVLVDDISIFDGPIEDIDFGYPIDGVSTATITAVDALGQLARKEFDEWTSTAGQLPGVRLQEVLDRAEVLYAGPRSIDPGVSVLTEDLVTWGSNVRNYAQLISASDLGRFFVDRSGVLRFIDRHSVLNQPPGVEFTDTDAGVLYQGVTRADGTRYLFNRVSIDRVGGIKQTAHDLTSQGRYGIRSDSRGGLLLDDDNDAMAMANYLLSLYSTPTTRLTSFSVIVPGLDTVQKQRDVVALDIGDVVFGTHTPEGLGTAVEQLTIVEGVAHTLAPGSHSMTVTVSPAEAREFFVLDDPVRGVLDSDYRLAF